MFKQREISWWGIYSVWHRHATVYRQTWLVNSIPPLSEPLIYLFAFGYGLTPLVGAVNYLGHPISYLQFIAPGMIAVGVLFQSFFEGSFASFIRLNFQRTWQGLLTTPLTFAEVFLGELFWAASKGMMAGTLTGIVAVLWGLCSIEYLVLSLPLIVLGSLIFAALGLTTTGFVRTVDQINVPIFLFVVPMFTLCGTYFPRTTLPPLLGKFAGILPLASLADLLRWNLGLPSWWLWSLISLLLWLGGAVTIAWRTIRAQSIL